MLLSLDDLTRISRDVLLAAGVPDDFAAVQADLLVESEARGRSSHGLQRLAVVVGRIEAGLSDPHSSGSHHWRGPSLLEVDGGGGLGPVVALSAIEAVAERARDHGVAVAAVSNTNHLGMLGWYVERVARAGQIAIALTTSEALVHPWGGVRAEVGSNPIAIGVPADPHPVVLDMATSATSMGHVQHLAATGRPLKPGQAVDGTGEPTLDARAALEGAISPFGGSKGYALGLAIEVLVGAMTGTSYGRAVLGTLDTAHPSTKGDLFVVLQPPADLDAGALARYLADIRNTPRRVAHEPVLVPGDGGLANRERSAREGVEIPDALVDELTRLTARLREATTDHHSRVTSWRS